MPAKLSTEEFIKRATIKHEGRYTYNHTKYNGTYSPVVITCELHGNFSQLPRYHMLGCGCPTCGLPGEYRRLTLEEVIRKSIDLHGSMYEYDNVNYINNSTKVSITCKEHGEFLQTPMAHLAGNGCPSCRRRSKGEATIQNYLEALGVPYIKEKTFMECISLESTGGQRLRFDFYLPNYGILIEFDGQQHFKPWSYSSDKSVETMQHNLDKIKERDTIKTKYAETQGIPLIRIPYTKVSLIPDILNNVLFMRSLIDSKTGIE